jgi:hypothetical protein
MKEEEIENIKHAEQRKRGNPNMTNVSAVFIIILKMFGGGSKHEYTDEQNNRKFYTLSKENILKKVSVFVH